MATATTLDASDGRSTSSARSYATKHGVSIIAANVCTSCASRQCWENGSELPGSCCLLSLHWLVVWLSVGIGWLLLMFNCDWLACRVSHAEPSPCGHYAPQELEDRATARSNARVHSSPRQIANLNNGWRPAVWRVCHCEAYIFVTEVFDGAPNRSDELSQRLICRCDNVRACLTLWLQHPNCRSLSSGTWLRCQRANVVRVQRLPYSSAWPCTTARNMRHPSFYHIG